MVHYPQEKFAELVEFVSTHSANRDRRNADQKAIEENLKWNASLFFAKAIYLTKPIEKELTLEEFEQFKNNYENQNDKQINTAALFQKYWLRNILGKIKIAGTVSLGCHEFSSISGFRNELTFLFEEFTEGKEGKEEIVRNDFDQIRHKYEEKNNLKLSDEGLYKSNWFSESGEIIQIFNINHYFKPFLDYWEEFEFLSIYKDHISHNKGKGFKIIKSDLQQLHESFNQFYTQTPSIDNLIDQAILSEKDEFYYLNFRNVKIDYWSALGDQITAFYWQFLIDGNHFSDDKERIKRLLQQTLSCGWPSDFLNHSINESKRKFLDVAFDLVANEPDLEGIESEFKKVSIDGDFGSREFQTLFHSNEEYGDFSLNNSDYFELLESLDNWEEKARTTYLHGQSSRDELSFLIMIIVTHDYESEREETSDLDNPKIHHYKRIFRLLEESLTKPTLLWYIKCFTIMCHREFIPYLIKDSKYTSLAFKFIDRINEYLLYEDKETIHKKLWGKSMELALFTIRSIVHNGDAPKLIFQIYRQLNSRKYDIPYNRQERVEKLSRKQKEEKERAVLSLIEDSSLYNHRVNGGRDDQFLIPELLNELVTLFINLQSKSRYNNGTVSFPMLQWDGLAWLMKCSTYWKYKSQFNIKSPNIHSLTHAFFRTYIDRIELTKVKQYNYLEEKEEGLPKWSEKIERLEHIEWIYPIYFIYQQQKLNSFLEPRFYFNPTSDQYDKLNHFKADKLRTHIGVLIHVLRKLVLPTIPYGFEKSALIEIRSRIEQQIIDYVKNHIKDIPEEGRIDLFNYNKESAFKTSEKEALFPQIARSLNWFEKKDLLIEAVLKTNDILKILTIAEGITSEGIKKKLIQKIQQSDIQSFLGETHWVPEVHQVLLGMRQYPELIKKVEQIVEFWEKKISKKSREYEIQLYQTKMLLTYFRKDEKELDAVKEPLKSAPNGVRELSYLDHKQFYRALIKLDKEPKSSFIIFNQLSTRYPHYPVFALNQMAAKISIAKDNNNDLNLYREALEEWADYASKRDELDEESLGSNFFNNKLFILLKLGHHREVDKTFSLLEMPYQMIPDVLDTKIESLLERKRIDEAVLILEQAENYHQFSEDDTLEFIKALKFRVTGIDDSYLLSTYYTRIYNSPPSKLIKIFPDKLNGNRSIQGFVTKEIATAASKMLDKIVSISEIKSEDKYNDVMELYLDARINSWGWYVGGQSRGGYSDPDNNTTKKQPGERDLPIHDSNKELFCICEAFIFRNPLSIKSHLKKIFDYYHQRDNLVILTYDVAENSKSKSNWSSYLNKVLPETHFPIGYKFISCEDVTNEFGYKNSAIKIAKSIHEGEVTLHHVFVNINYKVNSGNSLVSN